MKLGTLFAKFAAKAGINTQDPKYADILAVAAEIPDEDANKISGSLFTVAEAKDNLELKNYFRAQALDPADAEMKTIMSEMGFSTEDMAELQAEKNTYQRINKLTKKIQHLESKKADATGKEKKEYTEEINKLRGEITKVQQTAEAEKKQMTAEFNNRLIDTSKKAMVRGKNFALKDIPIDVNIEVGMIAYNKFLEKKGAKLVMENGILVPKQLKDESLDWYSETNEKLTAEQLLDLALAESKLLAVNDATPNGHQNAPINNGGGNNGAPIISGNGRPLNSQSFQDALNRNIANNKQAMERTTLIGPNTP